MSEIIDRPDVTEKRPPVAPPPRPRRTRYWIAGVLVLVVAAIGWAGYSHIQFGSTAAAAARPPAEVTVSKPLARELDTQLSFLGQFSAVDRVEMRAQVGGTLTGIYFKDGAIVHAGDLLFTIDPRPYEIKLAQATAQLQVAEARRALADQELHRAQELKRTDVGTLENVEQRTSDEQAAQASIDDAKAQIDDANFDIQHCRIAAPFTGRVGTHLVSVGNLVAGSRAASSPTTLLATLVSLDPIHLDFDMSESDFLTFSRYRAQSGGPLANTVEIALSDEQKFARQGTLDFLDNALDRSSGTIEARATVPNPDLFLTPGEFARLRLVVSRPAPTLLVPDSAVLPDQSQHIVMTVSNEGTVVPKPVEIGDLRDGLRVIRSGLDPNDRVIVHGIVYAAPGTKVATQEGAIDTSSSTGHD